nr:cyanophycin synthetase [Longispora sp. (in: high G+C Gram-positive bacteria)]
GGAIVDMLYPAGAPSRIPTIAVTGTNGKTTTVRLTAHLLAEGGCRVGVSTTDGVYVAGRLIYSADATGPASAQMILGDPTVDVAVLETARGGLLRRGLGYDWSDVGIITNIDAEHLGQDGLETVDDLMDVKSVVAEHVRDGGTLILNADDMNVRSLVDMKFVRAEHKNVVWFSVDSDNPVVNAHVRSGERAYVLEDGWLVEYTGTERTALSRAGELPGAFGGVSAHAIANALAALAASRAVGIAAEVADQRLRAFDPWIDNPGRGMLWQHGDVYMLIDYAHNAHGIAAMAQTVSAVWGRDRGIALVNLPGDRRDDLLEASARAVADGFDRILVYDGDDLRGRKRDEIPGIVCEAIADYRPEVSCSAVPDMAAAITEGLRQANPGDVMLVMYEKIDPVLDYLTELGATPVSPDGETASQMAGQMR